MFFIVSKILSFLLNPFFWLMALLIWSLVTKNLVRRKKLILATFGLIFIFGNGVLVNEVGLMVEKKWRKNAGVISADTAVLLGGFCLKDNDLDRVVFAESADRFYQILQKFQSKEISILVVSGGSGSLQNPEQREALLVEQYIKEGGFRSDGLILESESKNTFENAENTKLIIGVENPRILLVTSAFHMNRAMKVFKKAGFDPQPYPTHFMFEPIRKYNPETFLLPNARSFQKWELLTKEWLGLLVYKLKGYL